MVNVEQVFNLVWEVILIPAIYVLGKYVVQYIQAQTAKLKAETQNDTVDKYIGMAEDAVCRAVIAVNQTYVETLKKQGTFDKAAQDAAFESAKNMALAMMTEDVKAVVSSAVADFDIWLTTTIENTVNANKKVIVKGATNGT